MKEKLISILCILNCYCLSYAQSNKDLNKLLDSAVVLIRNDKPILGKKILDKLNFEVHDKPIDSFKMALKDKTAFYYFLQGDYEKCVAKAYEASDMAKKLGYRKTYFDLKNNIGAILSKLDEFEKAKNIYKEILKESYIEEDSLGYVSTLTNLASSYSALKEIDSSNLVLDDALYLIKKINDKELEAYILKFIAKNDLESKKYENVISTVNTLENKFWNNLRLNHKDDAIYYRCKAYFNIGNFDSALADVKKVLALAEVQKRDPAILDALSLKAEILAAKNQFKKAFNIQKQVFALSDSIDLQSRKEKVLELERKYETEKKEKENAILKAESYNKDLTITQKNNLLLIIFVLAIVVITLMVLWQLKKFKSKNKQLKALIDKMERLQKELDIVRDNIAKDFHDDLGNKLARITTLSDYVIKNNKRKNKLEMLDAFEIIKQDADELYSGTRDFMFSLKSDNGSAEDVYAYLADFAEDFTSNFEIDLLLSCDIEKNINVPYYWNRQIILIFKEAITNAVKHAKATNLNLNFICKSDNIHIVFKDDGIGFNHSQMTSKNGLLNMTQRAKKINCNLKISSNKEGTEICFKGKIPNFEALKIA
jgi:signal transduction histidine kinase